MLISFSENIYVLFPLTILNSTYDSRLIGLRFSPNGKSILLTTNGSLMRLLDAFNGHPLQTFAGHLNNKGIPVDGCFSPDSKVIYHDTLFKSSILVNSPTDRILLKVTIFCLQFVLSGSTDGRVHVWDAESGYKVCVLNGGHVGPVQCVQFNPSFMMMASACTHLNMWLPNLNQGTDSVIS